MDDDYPADPFGANHANLVQILEQLRGFRRAGGGLIESAIMVAAMLSVAASGGEAPSE